METIVGAIYSGLMVFALNGLVMVAMLRRVAIFEARVQALQEQLRRLTIRRRR